MIYININNTNKTRIYYGSGILIKENLILTAEHNLYDVDDGGFPDLIECYAACYLNSVLAHAQIAPKENPDSVVLMDEFIRNDDSSKDIGLIVLKPEDAATITTKVGSFAIPLTYSDGLFEKIKEVSFHVTGYPGERNAYTMQGTIQKSGPNKMRYEIVISRRRILQQLSLVLIQD